MSNNSLTDLYQKIKQSTPDKTTPITLLSINVKHTQVATQAQTGESDVICFDLTIGLQNIAKSTFKHYPPKPAEMEHAIMLVEDEIMPLAKKLPPHSRLFLVGEALTFLATLNVQEKNSYELEEIEDRFRRLAEVIEGSPIASSRLPIGNEFATLLLIVREFMHHLKFESITLFR